MQGFRPLGEAMNVPLRELVSALENDEIVAHFQPIVELDSGMVRSFEALARWNHPLRGPIPPETFVAMAETSGLIGTLTHQVFCKAFEAARFLHEPLTLAVNITPSQI